MEKFRSSKGCRAKTNQEREVVKKEIDKLNREERDSSLSFALNESEH